MFKKRDRFIVVKTDLNNLSLELRKKKIEHTVKAVKDSGLKNIKVVVLDRADDISFAEI